MCWSTARWSATPARARVASAAHEDYAAAAPVLTGEGHENQVYELSGDVAWSFAEFAAEAARQSDKPVVYHDVPTEQILLGAGLRRPDAEMFTDVNEGIQRGEPAITTGDLARPISLPL
ncbi:hypothetical protein ACWEO4_46075 [Streptomyces sp. NPDC004393]